MGSWRGLNLYDSRKANEFFLIGVLRTAQVDTVSRTGRLPVSQGVVIVFYL